MELNEVKKKLEDIFSRELTDGKKRIIVFWYDDKGDFQDRIDELDLSNAKILKLNGRNNFYAKYVLEWKDKESNYLVYAPYAKPQARENYLLDIEKYSYEFSTDLVTVIMRDLNVTNDSLYSAFKKYSKFFKNKKERYNALKKYSIPFNSSDELDIAVLSVLCKLPYPDLEEVLKVLLEEYAYGKSAFYENIEKFGDVDSFWELIGKYYGYSLEQRDIETLAVFLLITGLAFSLKRELPKQWHPFVSSKQSNVVVFLSRFMGGNTRDAFRLLSKTVQNKLKLENYIKEWDVDSYKDSDMFCLFDECIIQNIIENLLSDTGEFTRYKDIIMGRRNKHWFDEYKNEYSALYWASVLFEKWKEYGDDIREYQPADFFKKYVEEYYIIDTAYRKFIYFFDRLKRRDWFELLKDKVENTYVNGFVNTLSIKWSNSIQVLQGHWGIGAVQHQWKFFNEHVKQHIKKGERVFVIISDALRFEAAKEFVDILNTERKGSTHITALQGVIPSYTSLGIAALMPHDRIEINSNYGVLVDGISIDSTDSRNAILQKHVSDSIAIQYRDIMELKKDELRKLLSGKELVYIYHNDIDAVGDHYPTEMGVFDAVEETFEKLRKIVNNLVNNLSATHIYITADHGFIYKRGNVERSEKTLKEEIDNAYQAKRFILTDKPSPMEGTMSFDMKYVLGDNTQLKCIVPRGANRFEMRGAGVNYVHGGSLPQETVIPLIYFKNERGKSAKEVQKVRVVLSSLTRKITNIITYLEFFQTEKVGGKIVPCRVKVYFADEDGNRISNENIIIADSKADNPEERKFKEKFVLKNMKYDKTKKYYLIIEEEEENVESIYEKIPFIIDLIIVNDDFGF